MDVLCADKTGTITENKLSIADIAEMNGYKKDDALLFGALASQKANQDPIDLAFFSALEGTKLKLGEYEQKKFIPLTLLPAKPKQ
jgi:H+-transporting ATPase